jgi:vesicle coat complex subunit
MNLPIPTIAATLLICVPAFAQTREEQAKKFAADLKDKNAKVRLTALQELAKLGQVQRRLTAPHTPDILKALTDSDAAVRGEAANTLGLIDPEDKKATIAKIVELLKNEKSETAREGQEKALGALGATTDDSEAKRQAREALLEARKKTDSKREQKVIQAALLLITGPKKKKD